MTHDEFLSNLKLYHLHIKVESSPGETNYSLYVNDTRVSNSQYEIFGYYCGGAYAQCNRTNKVDFSDEDLHNAIRTAILVLSTEIIEYKRSVNYFDCIQYLGNVGTTKVDKDSFKRAIAALKAGYTLIWSSKSKL